jgi:hypothetical protein
MTTPASPDAAIRDLPSLGPKSQEMLARAGIMTVAQLRELGSAAACVQTKRANGSTQRRVESRMAPLQSSHDPGHGKCAAR